MGQSDQADGWGRLPGQPQTFLKKGRVTKYKTKYNLLWKILGKYHTNTSAGRKIKGKQEAKVMLKTNVEKDQDEKHREEGSKGCGKKMMGVNQT